jgi:uncharacterized membrane protein YGL010W
MRRTARLDSWIASYGNDHRNPVNHAIHMVCIPLIVFTALGLLNWIPLHRALMGHAVGLGDLGMVLLLAFFARHDLRLALLALPFAALMIVGARYLPPLAHLATFLAAWTAQFFGHGLWEKNRPSLMSNLVSLFVAPAFLLDGVMGGGTEKQN